MPMQQIAWRCLSCVKNFTDQLQFLVLYLPNCTKQCSSTQHQGLLGSFCDLNAEAESETLPLPCSAIILQICLDSLITYCTQPGARMTSQVTVLLPGFFFLVSRSSGGSFLEGTPQQSQPQISGITLRPQKGTEVSEKAVRLLIM